MAISDKAELTTSLGELLHPREMASSDHVDQEGKERLRPSLTNPNWLILRQRREIFRNWFDGISGTDLSVLDIGGRLQPYRALCGPRLAGYWAIDVREGPLVDVLARGEAIPFKTGSFDVAICSQVLEYIPEPKLLISEAHRVLKPGGALLLSAPAVFPRDSEHDLWRFMPQSLRLLLRDFGSVEIVPEGTSVTAFFRMLALYAVMFAKPAPLRKVVSLSVVPILNIGGALLQAVSSSTNDQFSANFSALARK